MPDQMDTRYNALMQQVGNIQSGEATQAPKQAGFFESLIEAVPLMMGAAVDDGGATMKLVDSISQRRKMQKELDRQNAMELRKFQLEAGLKGFQAELARMQAQEEMNFNKQINPLKIENERLLGDRRRQEVKEGTELFPVELEGKKAANRRAEQEILESGARTKQLEADAVLKTSKAQAQDEAMFKVFPEAEVYGNNPTENEGRTKVVQTKLFKTYGPMARPIFDISQQATQYMAQRQQEVAGAKTLDPKRKQRLKEQMIFRIQQIGGELTPKQMQQLDIDLEEVGDMIGEKPSKIVAAALEQKTGTVELFDAVQAAIKSGIITEDEGKIFAKEEKDKQDKETERARRKKIYDKRDKERAEKEKREEELRVRFKKMTPLDYYNMHSSSGGV